MQARRLVFCAQQCCVWALVEEDLYPFARYDMTTDGLVSPCDNCLVRLHKQRMSRHKLRKH